MKRLMFPLSLLLPGAAQAHEGDHSTSLPAHVFQSPDHAVVVLALTGVVVLGLRWLARR